MGEGSWRNHFGDAALHYPQTLQRTASERFLDYVAGRSAERNEERSATLFGMTPAWSWPRRRGASADYGLVARDRRFPDWGELALNGPDQTHEECGLGAGDWGDFGYYDCAGVYYAVGGGYFGLGAREGSGYCDRLFRIFGGLFLRI
jgi:hypothetical protein